MYTFNGEYNLVYILTHYMRFQTNIFYMNMYFVRL